MIRYYVVHQKTVEQKSRILPGEIGGYTTIQKIQVKRFYHRSKGWVQKWVEATPYKTRVGAQRSVNRLITQGVQTGKELTVQKIID